MGHPQLLLGGSFEAKKCGMGPSHCCGSGILSVEVLYGEGEEP
jgi:hypothetical protein